MSVLADPTRLGRRVKVLRECGAQGAVLDEVLAYTEPVYSLDHGSLSDLLEDDPHITQWLTYELEARQTGTIPALRARFVQLRFPVEAGISRSEPYRSATLRGQFEAAEGFEPGLIFEEPEAIHLSVHPTIAGRIPVITARNRRDFEALVCAFTERNEPTPVPESMGACLVSGLINWNRIAAYRDAWRARHSDSGGMSWDEEFRRLAGQKHLYQDRLFILSEGPYSAVSAVCTGLAPDDWHRHSQVIRREHEATHYFTARVFGKIRSHLLDELLADFVGITRAFRRYPADLALRCLGLEAFPEIRRTGRLWNYTVDVLSEPATAVVASLLVRGAANLEQIAHQRADSLFDLAALADLTAALASLTLEEMATFESVCASLGHFPAKRQ